ncbi:MAG: hypothetical protein EZS28_000809 [Streblomastix strix]|uniref:Uncharacterized protein n=1 Tax=Streblomastix strix TaxID=222440 RepID=A0A5J4XB06_9EUKA|nr:MAG: hypothetical protein EZS28_000809 [Streblomastix strix]
MKEEEEEEFRKVFLLWIRSNLINQEIIGGGGIGIGSLLIEFLDDVNEDETEGEFVLRCICDGDSDRVANSGLVLYGGLIVRLLFY